MTGPGELMTSVCDGVLTVLVVGEVDACLHDRSGDVMAAIWAHEGRVELDLGAVTFFGAEGVAILLGMYHAAPPGTVSIAAASPAVERTLALCGIGQGALPRHHGAS